jgi:uncharacterized protein YdaU (DUF1376 family)
MKGLLMAASKLMAEWFWVDRWTGSRGFLLPLEARGLYREMLTQAWRRGARLPNNLEAIQRSIGVTKAEWRRCWPMVQPFWTVEGDSLVNETQVRIYAEARAGVERASEHGRRGRSVQLARAGPGPGSGPARADARAQPGPGPGPGLRSPISGTHSPPSASSVNARAREHGLHVFCGANFCVSPRMHELLEQELGDKRTTVDLLEVYRRLDARGEAIPDLLPWLKREIARETGVSLAGDEPTAREVEKFDAWRRAIGGCGHGNSCATRAECLAKFIAHHRGKLTAAG